MARSGSARATRGRSHRLERDVASPKEMLGYAQTVGRGSPVDRPWSTAGVLWSMLRHGRRLAPKDSPLTLQDVLANPEYRDLTRPKVSEGDVAPDFELTRIDGGGTIQLSELLRERPVALVFGSYT
jgi:hypothetical protein